MSDFVVYFSFAFCNGFFSVDSSMIEEKKEKCAHAFVCSACMEVFSVACLFDFKKKGGLDGSVTASFLPMTMKSFRFSSPLVNNSQLNAQSHAGVFSDGEQSIRCNTDDKLHRVSVRIS